VVPYKAGHQWRFRASADANAALTREANMTAHRIGFTRTFGVGAIYNGEASLRFVIVCWCR
jgi:hypothetical protein